MNRHHIFFFILTCFQLQAPSAGAGTNFRLSDAEARALDRSLGLKAAKADYAEARDNTAAQCSTLLPTLTFDARYAYEDVVPSLNVAGAPAPFNNIAFSSRNTYSIGPTLSYTLWDQGAGYKMKKSLGLLAEARASAVDQAREEALNNARLAYAKLQLAMQELQLTQESSQLAETQHKDIGSRLGAGAASRLDFVIGQSGVLDFRLRHSQAEAQARAAMIDLFATMNDLEHLPHSLEELTLDSIDETVKRFDDPKLSQDRQAIGGNPQLKAQAHAAESADAAVASQRAAYYPRIDLQARASLDYPNGPDLSQIQQKTVGVMLTVPLLDWGRTGNLVGSRREAANAAHFREKQMEVELARNWAKAVDELSLLREQRKVALEAVTESQRSASLTYKTYRAGHLSLTDVQNTNLRWLEARVRLARVDGLMLTELLSLNALTGRDVGP